MVRVRFKGLVEFQGNVASPIILRQNKFLCYYFTNHQRTFQVEERGSGDSK